MSARVGFLLPPDLETLELLGAFLLEEPDGYEVTPETLWYEDGAGVLHANSFHARFLALGAATRRPFVAHGVGLSMGGTSRADAVRRRRLLSRMRVDQSLFGFQWYTDHMGLTSAAGEALALPLPLPMTDASARSVRRTLRAMQSVVPDAGVETTAHYFLYGDPLDDAAFYARTLTGPRQWLLLDLHNVHTMAVNMGFDAREYVRRLPLERVLEIHVSGGSWSDGAWLPSGRVLRLDGHDGAVPEEVWTLLEAALPHCPRLAAVTLERLEGTVTETDIASLREEMRRLRRLVARRAA